MKWEAVRFQTDNELSIRKAEKRKAQLENMGYKLVAEDIGLFTGALFYKKENDQ